MKYLWDCETYPNIFVACFLNADDPTDRYAFAIHKGRNDYDGLMEFVDRNLTLIGFNNCRFDDVILKALMSRYCNSVKSIHTLANNIISNSYDKIPYWDLYNYSVKFESLDCMKLHRLRELGVGLKYAGVIIKHPKIQDLPFPPNTIIPTSEFDTVIDYCFNDCEITRKIFLRSTNELNVRKTLGKLFNVNVDSLSRPGAAKEVMLQLYSRGANISLRDLKQMTTDRNNVSVKDCISPNLRFDTEYLQNFLAILKTLTLHKHTFPIEKELVCNDGLVEKYDIKKHTNQTPFGVRMVSNFKYATNLTLANKTFDLGIGGLHSRDGGNDAGVFVTDDTYNLISADVSSYYPWLQIVYKIKPEHLSETYTQILEDLTNQKMTSTDPNKTIAFKIIVNSLFGQLGDVYSPFLDQKAMTTVTLSGQLFLLDLIEKLDIALDKTILISANTDGVLYKVHKSEREQFKQVCSEWASRIGMLLDYEYFKKVVLRDVNNYLAISTTGKVKTKGVFYPGELKDGIWEKPLEKGYDAPVVSIAMYKYFVEGTPVEETITNHTDIHDFIICKKVGRQFHSIAYDGNTDELQQKTNRIIITTEGMALVKKHKDTGKINNLVKKELMMILNDIEDTNAKKYPIRYGYYIDRAKKIIDLVEPRQEALF